MAGNFVLKNFSFLSNIYFILFPLTLFGVIKTHNNGSNHSVAGAQFHEDDKFQKNRTESLISLFASIQGNDTAANISTVATLNDTHSPENNTMAFPIPPSFDDNVTDTASINGRLLWCKLFGMNCASLNISNPGDIELKWVTEPWVTEPWVTVTPWEPNPTEYSDMSPLENDTLPSVMESPVRRVSDEGLESGSSQIRLTGYFFILVIPYFLVLL